MLQIKRLKQFYEDWEEKNLQNMLSEKSKQLNNMLLFGVVVGGVYL